MIYRRWSPKPETARLVQHANAIIEDYAAQGYDMTLRQFYYQLVAANLIPNTQRQYARLSQVMTRARWAGLTALDALYDPGREPKVPSLWASPQQLLSTAADQYATNRWRNAESRVELWAEKDAVASVLRPVADRWQVPYQSCRGFMGLGALAQAARRATEWGGHTLILYAGDHDASGQAIPSVLEGQLGRMVEGHGEVGVQVIALTLEQVREHDPPPQPAKRTDSRTRAYVAKHGMSDVWELDALRPNVLGEIADGWIESFLPHDYYDIEEQDDGMKQRIRELGSSL